MLVKTIKYSDSFCWYKIGETIEVEYLSNKHDNKFYYSKKHGLIHIENCMTLTELRKEKLNRILND